MATATQYNPNADLNAKLLRAGLSKTVYALVTPETEATKLESLGVSNTGQQAAYLEMFRDAWTSKQDRLHEEFFDTWVEWSSPVVHFERERFPFAYPTAGASEALRHLIYDFAARYRRTMLPPMIHIFRGEYEGYRAMAEAAGVAIMEWDREDWRGLVERLQAGNMGWTHLCFVSAPSAIDGNIWLDLNAFLSEMPTNSVVLDATYVGAVPSNPPFMRLDFSRRSIRNVVFSLSKPFGVYYDRIGGVFCREEDLGLFGNRWFKNLTSLAFGTRLMKTHGVFDLPNRYRSVQEDAVQHANRVLGLALKASDVYLLATAPSGEGDLAQYLNRAGRIRACVTPAMATAIGTSGVVK